MTRIRSNGNVVIQPRQWYDRMTGELSYQIDLGYLQFSATRERLRHK